MSGYNWPRLMLGGAIIGLLDLCAASLSSGRSLYVICQSVASGWYGKASYDLGDKSAAVGLISQVLMACLITAIFAVFARLRPELLRRPLVSGIAYGLIILIVMAFVVLPLSAVGQPMQFKSAARFTLHLLTMVAFGVAVAFVAHWAARPAMRGPLTGEALLID